MSQRRVVLICGPPGAGKTTYATTLGLDIYDVDDSQWTGEKQFASALAALGTNRQAQAVVIRSGATPTARQKAAALCQATEITVLATDPATCINRIIERGRGNYQGEIAAVKDWWARYQPDAAEPVPLAKATPRGNRTRSTTQRDRDRNTIRRGRPACAICGNPIDYTLPHKDPGEFVVDHIVPLKLDPTGDRLSNKQPAHRECNATKAARLVAPIVRRSGTLD